MLGSEDMFRFTLHTGFVHDGTMDHSRGVDFPALLMFRLINCAGMIRFAKKDLDDGYKDKKVADDFWLDLIFDERCDSQCPSRVPGRLVFDFFSLLRRRFLCWSVFHRSLWVALGSSGPGYDWAESTRLQREQAAIPVLAVPHHVVHQHPGASAADLTSGDAAAASALPTAASPLSPGPTTTAAATSAKPRPLPPLPPSALQGPQSALEAAAEALEAVVRTLNRPPHPSFLLCMVVCACVFECVGVSVCRCGSVVAFQALVPPPMPPRPAKSPTDLAHVHRRIVSTTAAAPLAAVVAPEGTEPGAGSLPPTQDESVPEPGFD